MSKLNILHLRASNFYGGPERQLHFHARHAKGSDFSITVGSFTERGQSPHFLKVIAEDKIETCLFQVKNAYDPKAVVTVRNYLAKNDTGVLCTHDYRTHFIGWLATRRRKTKWMAFSRGWTRENIKVRVYHIIDKVILRLADHIVAVSEAQKHRLTRLLIPEGKISAVHNAVEPQQFENIEKIDLRSKYGFASDTFVYVSAGRFSREKGQTYLVKAADVATKRDPRICLVMFGDGPDLTRVRRMVTRLDCEDRIVCPGFEKNMLGCIKGADALVNPSLSEGLPNVVLEAMALGVPVVATAVGGVPEIIKDGQTGFLVPPRDPPAMAKLLLHVCQHTDQAAKVAEAALQYVNDNLTFDKQYQELTAIYRELLSL